MPTYCHTPARLSLYPPLYKDETEKGYYLLVEDHFIVVYEEDRQRLHMNTDILLTSLNDTLKAEIIQGKYIENEEELYNFLESSSVSGGFRS